MKVKRLYIALFSSLILILGSFVSQAAPGNPDPSPAPNSLIAAPSSNVSVTYGEDIDATTVNYQTFAVHAMQTGLVLQTHGVNGACVIASPSQDFHPGELVQVTATTDILGTSVFDMSSGKFYLKRGPIFTNLLLADEINRAPAKTQSALLEAMEERQVNLEGQRYPLEPPFMVVATQNPIEYEGTYPLPEAQLDRFLFKVLVPYSAMDVEVEVLRRYHAGFDAHDLDAAGLEPVISAAQVVEARKLATQVTVEEGILTYIAQIAATSRRSTDLILGASPRASTHILLASKVYAALQGRDYVSPDDVKFITFPVLRHRLLLKPEAEIERLDADAVIQRLLRHVDVPR